TSAASTTPASVTSSPDSPTNSGQRPRPTEGDGPMSLSNMVEQLKGLSNPERLAVIEAAIRLIRDELVAQSSSVRTEDDRRLRDAAAALTDLYEPGGPLTEWTTLIRRSSWMSPSRGEIWLVNLEPTIRDEIR